MPRQYQVRTGPIEVTVPFSVEMTAGYQPAQPRLFLAPRIPLPLNQTTHVEAPLSIEMFAGTHPDQNRAWLPVRLGQTLNPIDILPFSIETVQGSHPDQPRLFLGPRIPLPESQTSHVPAPDSPEMSAGWHPDTSRAWLPVRTGWQIAQTTHVEAPFSPEMVAGWHPDTPREFVRPRIGWQISQTTPIEAPFSVEMVAGSHPDTSRMWLPLRTGLQLWAVEVAAVSAEALLSSRPDQPRLFTYPREGLQISQTTHTEAPFSVEMTAGWQPAQPRLAVIGQSGWQWSDPAPSISPPPPPPPPVPPIVVPPVLPPVPPLVPGIIVPGASGGGIIVGKRLRPWRLHPSGRVVTGHVAVLAVPATIHARGLIQTVEARTGTIEVHVPHVLHGVVRFVGATTTISASGTAQLHVRGRIQIGQRSKRHLDDALALQLLGFTDQEP